MNDDPRDAGKDQLLLWLLLDIKNLWDREGFGIAGTETELYARMQAGIKLLEESLPPPCDRCEGCGQIANTNSGEAWTHWADMPVKSAAAVMMGIVRPISCPDCGGSGKVRPK